MMLANEWLKNTREVMSRIEETQMDNIQKAAAVMASYIRLRSRHPAHRGDVPQDRRVCRVSSDDRNPS
jgi:hypothetical protein